MAAPPPAKRQRTLAVRFASTQSNNDDTAPEMADVNNDDSTSRPITTTSRQGLMSRSRATTTTTTTTTKSTGSTATTTVPRIRQQRQQKQSQKQKPAVVSSPVKKGTASKGKKQQDGHPSRSLHSFFQPATDEQRWSFHRSEATTMPSHGRKRGARSSFTDELEEDMIEDDDYDDNDDGDYGFSEDGFVGITDWNRGSHVKTKKNNPNNNNTRESHSYQTMMKQEEGLKSNKPAVPPAPLRGASSRRFILGSDQDVISNTNGKSGYTKQKDSAALDNTHTHERRPWSEQYPPMTVEELAVHKKKVVDVQSWLLAAFSGRSSRHKLLVLHGPAGCGKTATISLLSTALNFEIVEWRSPFGTETGTGQYVSMSAQFDDFLSQLNGFGGLELSGSTTGSTTQMSRKRVILIEEFPASLARGSVALSSFQASLRRYLAAGSSSSSRGNMFAQNYNQAVDATPPIVIVISETMLGTSGAISENLTAHRLLGSDLYTNPGTSIIEFNPVAPTFMLKALQLVLKKEARHSMRQRIPGLGVLKKFSEIGDIRSAISSLEFLCLRNDKSTGWGGRVAAKTKGTTEIPLTAMEKESLELITQRESSLGLFHAVGKVVYNKRDEGDGPPAQSEEENHVAPPLHLKHFDRPKASQVSVEDMMDKTGTDVHTFTAALHENYPPSCDGPTFAETLEACIENLSDSDLLGSEARSSLSNSRSGIGTARGQFLGYGASIDRLRQDEISFHVAVRGMLFALPHPVRRKVEPSFGTGASSSSSSTRRGTGTFKMYFPTSQRLWKEAEEIEGLVSLWERQLLLDLAMAGGQKQTGPGRDSGVASWKTNQMNSGFPSNNESKSPHLTDSQSCTIPSVTPREDMLLYYLPYLSRIMGGSTKDNNASPRRALDRITQFRGIDAPKEDDFPDYADHIQAEAISASVNEWATDPVGLPAAPRAGFQKVKREEKVAQIADEQLFLSEDDIED